MPAAELDAALITAGDLITNVSTNARLMLRVCVRATMWFYPNFVNYTLTCVQLGSSARRILCVLGSYSLLLRSNVIATYRVLS